MRQLATFCTLLLTISLLPAWAQQDVISTFIGGGPNGIAALQADISGPYGVAFDASGNYYVAAANRVFKVDTSSGILTVVAGTGAPGYAGDTVVGGAANAQFNLTVGIAVDHEGNVYVSDSNNCIIREIDTKTKTVTTIAGVPHQCTYGGDNGPGTSAYLRYPHGLALDSSGNLYIADVDNFRIRKLILSTDVISTIAGTATPGYNGDNMLATSAELNYPTGVAIDRAGDVFIADQSNYRIREVAASTGIITTVCGNGTQGNTSTEIGLVYSGIAVNAAGTTVTIGDYTYSEIRQCAVGGAVSTVAGNGTRGFSGDNGSATSAEMNTPEGVAVASSGLIYFADEGNNRIRAFTVGEDINTVAGNGSPTFPTLVSGVPPSGVVFNGLGDVAEDPFGNVFISDQNNCMVRELVKKTGAGVVNIFAGSAVSGAVTGTCGFSIGPGPATDAVLGTVGGIASDSKGNIYIADEKNCVVWQVSAGDISIFAGANPPDCGYSGDGVAATYARLNGPNGVFVDSKDNVYIGDQTNNRVREVEVTTGIINTIAGAGNPGYLGDGDPATIAWLNGPSGVTVDDAGNVYIADYNNCVVREVAAATGIINTIAGNGVCGFNGDGIATEHELNHPNRVHVDANGNLFISDNNNELVRWVNPAGWMTTFAGDRTAGLSGDGGPALSAELSNPNGIAQDASGNFLIADYGNDRVREVTAFSALNVAPTSLDFELTTVGSPSAPEVVTLSALGPLTFSNISITGPFTESDDCGTGLSNANTCAMYVYFNPTAAGPASGTISIEDNGFFTGTATISLTATGSAIAVAPGQLSFPSEPVGQTSPTNTVTVTNQGTKSITMKAITVDDPTDFVITNNACTGALAGGAKCQITVVFAPASTGAKKGALVISDADPSSPQVVGLAGTGTSLVGLSPSPLAFATQAVGTKSSSAKIKLTNNTGSPLTLNNPVAKVGSPFALSAGPTSCVPETISPGGSCFIYVNFTPTAVGYATGTLSVYDSDPTSPQTVALSGTGTGVEFSPSPVSFPNTTVGQTSPQSVAISNVGTSTISFTAWGITGENAGDFSLSGLTDPPCSGSLPVGAQPCKFTVNFKPSTATLEKATLSVYDSSAGSPQSVQLSGTGTAQ